MSGKSQVGMAIGMLLATIAGAPSPAGAAVGGPGQVLYVADAYSGAGFQDYLAIDNRGAPGSAILTSYFTAAAPVTRTLNLPAGRSTVDVNRDLGIHGEVAFALDPGPMTGVSVERSEYFHACNWWGPVACAEGNSVAAGAGTATHSYLAEGYTGTGFKEYLSLFDPGAAPASVTVTYRTPAGPLVTRQVAVGGQRRATVDVNADVGAGREVAIELLSDQPIAAARTLYFSAAISGVGHVDGGTTAVSQPASTGGWLPPIAAPPSSHAYIPVLNPGIATANVTALAGGGQRTYSIPAGARRTLDLGADMGTPPGAPIELRADAPVSAERTVYHRSPYSTGDGASAGGLQSPAPSVALPEGYTAPGWRELLTAFNPGAGSAAAAWSLSGAGQPPVTSSVNLPPGGSVVSDVAASLGAVSASAVLDSSAPVLGTRWMDVSGCVAGSTCVDQPLHLNGVSPAGGSSAGGDVVTLSGTNFRASPTVTIGGLPAAVLSETASSMVISTPAHPTGPADVTISDVDGRPATLAGAFTYSSTPTTRTLPVPLYHQQFSLSCESASLRMALAFEGITTSDGQLLGIEGVDGRQATHDATGTHWGDPYANFVGNASGVEGMNNGSLSGYGTYWSTIARAAQAVGGRVDRAGEQVSPAEVYDWVLRGHPVVAWVAYDWRYHVNSVYTAFDGRPVMYAAPVEHTVAVVGSRPDAVLVNDPARGTYWISKAQFEAAYAMLDDMAVVID